MSPKQRGRPTARVTLWRRWLATAELSEREARVVERCRLRDWETPDETQAAAWVTMVDQLADWRMPVGGGGLGDLVVVEALVRRFDELRAGLLQGGG